MARVVVVEGLETAAGIAKALRRARRYVAEADVVVVAAPWLEPHAAARVVKDRHGQRRSIDRTELEELRAGAAVVTG